jgi:hypothetical protein
MEGRTTLVRVQDKAYEVKFYPPYGQLPSRGYTLGVAAVWPGDVFRFLNRY